MKKDKVNGLLYALGITVHWGKLIKQDSEPIPTTDPDMDSEDIGLIYERYTSTSTRRGGGGKRWISNQRDRFPPVCKYSDGE